MLTSPLSPILAALAISGIALAENLPTGLSPEKRIDQLIEARLRDKQLEPNAPIDDDAFLRRAFLDLAGRIPTIEEATTYRAVPAGQRREWLVDNLLQSEGYVSHFYHFWADILRINSRLGTNETPPAVEYAYRLWLKKALRENTPYDAFVRKLVGARGHSWENGAIGYYQRDRGMPLENMSNTVRIFLGTRLDCAQCHDHPFDRWTQLDYYKMAAFTYGVESQGYIHPNRQAMDDHLKEERLEVYRRTVAVEDFPVFSKASELNRSIQQLKQEGHWERSLERYGLNEAHFINTATKGIEAIGKYEEQSRKVRRAEDVLHIRIRYVTTIEKERTLQLPHDYQYSDANPFDAVTARALFKPEITTNQGSIVDGYADWITSKDNPTFTRVIANRLWKKIFGHGVFEPVDGITESTYVSNPELMDFLEKLMRDLDYDMKAYLAVLCKTKAYRRAASRGEREMGSPYYFQGPTLRRMSAEQVWDSIVGLVLPEVDYYNPDLNRQLATIDRIKTIYESLADITAEEYIATVEGLRETIDTNLTMKNLVAEQRRKAHTEKNEALFRQKTDQLRTLEREVADQISLIQNTRHRDLDETERLASFGITEMTRSKKGEVPQEKATGSAVITKRHKPKFPKPPRGLSSDQIREWRTEQKAEYDSYLSFGSKWARASSLPSPAPRGHFLREFGQSDREVIENAADQASVPQALALMNGPVAEALTNRFGVLGARIHAAASPDEKIALLFEAMLTRQPTEREKEIAQIEITNHGEKAYHNLVWSLLNTRQFLFVP